MGYLITAFAALSALVKKNSRFVFVAFLGLLWLLYGLNVYNPDYGNYAIIYDNIDNQYFLDYYYSGMANESGFRLLCKIFYNLGFSYQMFVLVFSFAGLLLLSKVVWKYSLNPNVVMVLYFIYPFAIDVVQIRSFMAMVIVLYFMQYLVDEDTQGIPKYIIGVFIATSIHVSAIFYLLLVLVKVLSIKECYYFSIIGIVCIIFIYLNSDMIAELFSFILPANKIKNWLSGDLKRSMISILSTVGLRIGWMILIAYFYSAYKRKLRRGTVSRDHTLERLYKCNIILLITLGFEIFVKQYERLGRITFIIGYIIFSRLFELRRTRFLPWLFVFGFMGVYFVFIMFFSEAGTGTYFEQVFKSLFENNWLLNYKLK